MHALSHLPQCMEWWGPLSNVWQFANERFCGLLISRCKSRAFTAANIHQILMTRLGLQALMKSKDSGIHLWIHQNPTPVDLLCYPEKDLFFITPKRPIHYELGSEVFSKLVTFYAQRDRLRVSDIVIERSGILWERMESKGLVFGI